MLTKNELNMHRKRLHERTKNLQRGNVDKDISAFAVNPRKNPRNDNSLAGEPIYTVYEVTVAAIHTVGLLCVVASSGVA